jgi:hypothetical protein
MAFLPFEGRPLQTWIVAFFKAVYSPTQFLWKKRVKVPAFLEAKPTQKVFVPVRPISQDRGKLTEYLETLPIEKSPLEEKEEGFLSKITNLFTQVPLPPNIPAQARPLAETEEPAGIRIRRLGEPQVLREVSLPRPGEEIARAKPQIMPFPKYIPQRPTIIRRGRPPGKIAKPAQFAPEIPIPSTPTIPNILVGMVKDNQGKIVEGAILEIRDEQGNPVRALRSNKLGQFRIATPLSSGTYEIEIEKEGILFDIVKIELKGEIVQPIEIKAK